MRTVATIAVGLVAGIAGSLLVGAVSSSSAPPLAMPQPAQAQARAAIPPPAITPPGWSSRKPAPELQPQPEPAPETPKPESREQARLDHYQLELATQQSRLTDHAREPIDPSWSSDAADHLRAAAADLHVSSDVDCRSHTCVATLDFAQPADALAMLRSHDMSSLLRAGFSTMTSTPQPPDGDGSYQLTVILER